MKKLLIGLLMLISTQAKPQLTGCPYVNAGNDVTIPCNGNTTLTATFLQTGATTGYNVSAIPYTPPFAYTAGAPILIGSDDIWSGVLNLPFNFCFFNNTYNQIVVGANGHVTFDVTQAGALDPWSYTATIPTTLIPMNTINGPYMDIDPSIGGSIRQGVLGAYPCRTFVVNYDNVPMFSCTSVDATFQIVMFEGTNAIDVYIENAPACATWNSGNKLIGLLNSTGTIGIPAPGRNTSAWSTTNEAWRFTPNGAPNYVFEWHTGGQFGPLVSTNPTINVNPSVTTTYTAVITYTNCDGSVYIDTDDVTVTTSAANPVTISPTTSTICAGQSVTINVTNPVGTTTYQWSPATGLNTTTGTSVIATPATTTTYTVTATDNLNCATTATSEVIVNPNPIVTVNPAIVGICWGEDTTLVASGATTYSWSPATGLNTTTGSTVVTSTTAPIVYTVVGTTNNCSGSATAAINIYPLPAITATTPDNNICIGESTTLNGNGGLTYEWSPVTSLSSSTGTSVIATPAVTTTYTVTGTDFQGCSRTNNIVITVSPNPTISITPTSSQVCQGSNVTLTASGGNTYIWSPATYLNTTNGSTVIATPTALTPITYTVTGTDGNTCTSTATATINPYVVTGAVLSVQLDTCGKNTGSAEVIGSGGIGSYHYTWNTTPPQTTALVTNLPGGTYTVNISDDNGCSNLLQVIIPQTGSINVTASAISANCSMANGNASAVVTSSSYPGPFDYLWSTGDTIQSLNNLYPGTYTVTVSYMSCTATASVVVGNQPGPIADFTINQSEQTEESCEVDFIDNSIGAITWFWNFGDNTTSIIENPTHTYNGIGQYLVMLTVTDHAGCVDSTYQTIFVRGKFTIYAPNAFTPNNDIFNEYWSPKGTGIDPNDYHLWIYNRWGQIVYETTDINGKWDGTQFNKGGRKLEGVYVYVINVKDIFTGLKYTFKGNITLIE